jgi:uncharacterized membrane protein
VVDQPHHCEWRPALAVVLWRVRRALGSNWARLAEVTSNVPFAALVAGRTRLRWRDISLLRLIAGLLLYAVLYNGHAIIAGAPVVIP